MLHAARRYSRRPSPHIGTIMLLGITLSQIPLWYAPGSARFLVLWLVALGLSAVCAWRVPQPQRWLVGLSSLVSILSVLFISMHTGQRSGWWFVFIPLLGVVLVKLYLALSKRAMPLPAADALPDQTSRPHSTIARWWRRLLAILIPLHALSLGLYWAYTDHACSRFDLVRRVQGCALVRTPPTFPTNTHEVEISPSGALVASAAGELTPMERPFTPENLEAFREQSKTEGATISLWDLKTGRLLRTLEQPARAFGITFSADDQLVATEGADAQVRVWRVDDGSLLHTIPNTHTMTFRPDGSLLATTTVNDPNVRLWSMQDGTLLRTISLEHTIIDDTVIFTPDGLLLAVPYDRQVTLWRVADGTLQQTIDIDYIGHYKEAFSFSPDGQILATATTSYDKDVRSSAVQLWRVTDGTLLHTLNVKPVLKEDPYPAMIYLVSFSPDGTRVAVGAFVVEAGGGSKMTILIWRVADGALLEHIEPTSLPNLFHFNDDNTVLQIYDSNLETARVYDQRLTQPAAQ